MPDEWQRMVLEDWLAIRPDGRWASLTCGLSVPRQNGKNGIIEMRELFGMVLLGEKFLHTAHEVKTARKAFLRLASFFENERKYPELAEMVEDVRRTNGQEAIILHNGGSVEFVARSKGSGRGFTVDVLVMDEAQELSDDALEALMPTTSAAPQKNPQWIFTGTPPGPSANGEVFTRTRQEALDGKSVRLCWHEWSCDGMPDLDDREEWFKANPALGDRLQFDVLEGERARFSDDGFARERLGMWSSADAGVVIDGALWARMALTKAQVQRPDLVAFAIDVPPDRSTASIGIVGARPDGTLHMQLDQETTGYRGTAWVPARIAELVAKWAPCAVVLDASGPAGSLLAPLLEAGVEVVTTSAREMGQACGMFYDAATEEKIRHLSEPRLNAALAAARKRPLGDAWAWHRKGVHDISPLVAATLALWGFTTRAQREPKTKTPSKAFAF